jgi:putative Mg2+ transporter-C (MgtC) family protein
MDTITTLLNGVQTWASVREILHIELLAKLALATLLGGVIGWEREASGKPAGLRTNILMCVGAALLTDLSIRFGELAARGDPDYDPSRIAAQIVTGIGFLGAGTIMQAKGTVTGLTSAATIFVVAGIGMTAGAGAYFEAAGSTLLVLVILWPMGWVEDHIEGARRGRIFRVVMEDLPGKVAELQSLLEEAGLVVKLESSVKGREGEVQATFDVRGSSTAFRRCREAIMDMHEVKGVFRGG